MGTQKQRTHAAALQRLFVRGLLLTSMAIGCSQSRDGSTEVARSNQQELAADTASNSAAGQGDGTSLPAVVLYWEGSDAERHGTALTAVAQNTTDAPVFVDFMVLGVAPTGDSAIRPFGGRQVPAKSTVSLDVSVADLPAQSVGVASTVTLFAKYQTIKARFALDGVSKQQTAQTFTPTMHVTVDSGGGTAFFRTPAAEAHANAVNRVSAFAKLRSVRLYDSASGSMVDRTESAIGSKRDFSKPIVQVIDGSARPGSAVPSSRAGGQR